MCWRLCSLLIITACWSGVHVPEPSQPARPFVRRPPACWSMEFYNEWPREIGLYDVIDECRAEWEPDTDLVDSCVYTSVWREHQRLWYWVNRWFESCDPERRQ